MKTKIIVTACVTLVMLVVIACSKNAYNTKPTLKIKSINGNLFDHGSTMIVEIQVTDKEGDVTDSLFANKKRINRVPRTLLPDSIYYKVPDAPNSTDGIIQITVPYESLKGAQTELENDTIVYRFALRDKAGNTSDTISTDPIVVIRP